MPNDPLANMIERLRGRGWQPRKVGHDAWESKCPGHESRDHALALRRTADGKLDVKCRSVEQCSLSRIVKRLDIRIDNLFHETKPALIRRLRESAIEPSIYEPSRALIATNTAPGDGDPQRAPALDCPSSALSVPDTAKVGSDELQHDASSSVEHPMLTPVDESPQSAGAVVPAPEYHAQRDMAPSASGGDMLKIAGAARTFRRPDGGYTLSRLVDGHAECHDLDSPEVRRWLTREYFRSTGRVPSKSAVAGVVSALAAHADMTLSCEIDFVRIGRSASGLSYFIDLGDPTWRAVEITAGAWRIVPRPPVHFRRSPGQLALPVPEHGGSLALLSKYVNVESHDLPLLIAWLTAALRPVGPHPILVITGEQGSAKSTLARICRLLSDPHTAPLRAEPREHRDLMVAAMNSWVQAYDNISSLPDWLSNALCRLSTGGGISMRGLYTNHQEVVWSAQCPVIVNGISDFIQRPDVLDRSLCLQLRAITGSRRRYEEDLWAEFMLDYPRIFGAMVDLVASAMQLAPTIKLEELERMADFTRWGEAVGQAAGWAPGTFVSAYRGNRRASSVVALEDSELANALISLNRSSGPFKGTVTQLLRALADHTGSGRQPVPGWPKTPNFAATELRRMAPVLREVGLSVTFDRGANGSRLVSVACIDRVEQPSARRA